jgi:hypothetical protein
MPPCLPACSLNREGLAISRLHGRKGPREKQSWPPWPRVCSHGPHCRLRAAVGRTARQVVRWQVFLPYSDELSISILQTICQAISGVVTVNGCPGEAEWFRLASGLKGKWVRVHPKLPGRLQRRPAVVLRAWDRAETTASAPPGTTPGHGIDSPPGEGNSVSCVKKSLATVCRQTRNENFTSPDWRHKETKN